MIQAFMKCSPEIDESCFIAPGSIVIGKVSIGKNSSVWYNSVIRGDIAQIKIGENVNVQDGCVIHCVHDVDVHVENNVTIGHNAILHSCYVSEGSLIGMGAIILNGVKIGRNCLIGAGAVVTPNTIIPDKSLVLGNPAKIRRELDVTEIENIKSNVNGYTKLAEIYKSY